MLKSKSGVSRVRMQHAVGVIGIILPIAWTGSVLVRDPYTHIGPVCWFRSATGLACPGCGLTRSLYSALTGQWQQALELNAALPLFFLLWIWSAAQLVSPRPLLSLRASQAITNSLVAAILVFWVVRNLPIWPWPLPVQP